MSTVTTLIQSPLMVSNSFFFQLPPVEYSKKTNACPFCSLRTTYICLIRAREHAWDVRRSVRHAVCHISLVPLAAFTAMADRSPHYGAIGAFWRKALELV